MTDAIRPLGGHSVFLLLLQVALLIAVARVGAEAARRVGLPAVVGELLGGLALGPSVFGALAPGLFRGVFPVDVVQFHLLDVVGTLGMVLLLLITGFETDVRLLRNLGRPAFVASLAGMVLPFLLGFALGWLTPRQFQGAADRPVLFSFFVATVMSVSAMPVIAKILVDLDLTKRNIGLVILSAGVVDDTLGWLILSLIAGAASHGRVDLLDLGRTLLLLVAFLAAAAFVLHPLLKFGVRVANERFRTRDSDLVLVLVVTLACAAVTEWIGVHAVFGAFIAGVVLNQVPALRHETMERLEAFVYAILAPVFFGIVGLKVDLPHLLDQGGGGMLALVLGVACAGKLIGVTAGGVWSGLRFWEASSIAVAMNARGAVGIVVATIGLGLGLLSPAMFSILVVMAIVTSLLAPLGLRLTMPRVRMTDEEAQRMLAARSKGVFDPERMRVMIAVAANPGLLAGAPFVLGAAARSAAAPVLVHVDKRTTFWGRIEAIVRGRRAEPGDVTAHLTALTTLARPRTAEVRRVVAADVAEAIGREAAKGCDLLLIGSAAGETVGGDLVVDLIARAPGHVAIVKGEPPAAPYRSVFVPVDGSFASSVAAELALRYAEASGATLTLGLLGEGGAVPAQHPSRDEELLRVSVVFRVSAVKPEIVYVGDQDAPPSFTAAVAAGGHDLVVLGAENRAIRHQLFFGHKNEALIRESRVPVVVVVANLARLREGR